MRVLHDLICAEGHMELDVTVDPDKLPTCLCGSEMSVSWAHGKPPATDVKGSELYSEVTGEHYTSTREHERKMAARGYEPAGDKVGGSRSLSGKPRPLPDVDPEKGRKAWKEATERIRPENAKPFPNEPGPIRVRA
jgi:hypothetical protein